MMKKTIVQLFGCGCGIRVSRVNSYLLNSLGRFLPISRGLFIHRINFHNDAILYTRNFDSKDQKQSAEKDEAKLVSQWWVGYLKSLSFKERCISRVSKCLQCSEHKAKCLIDADELTFLDKIDSTMEKIEFLLECSITTKSIRNNVGILRLSFDELQTRLDHMKKWQIEKHHFSGFFPTFRLPITDYLLISHNFILEKDRITPDGNRMIYFARELECSVYDLNQRFLKCKQLFTHNFEEMRSALKCYRKFGVKNEYILRRISSLKCNEDSIQRRLSGPHEKGLHPLGPKLVLANYQVYERCVRELEQQIDYYRPYRNRDEYLAARLFNKSHIPPTKKKMIISFLEMIDTKKLISIMEFLIEKEFTADQIITNRRVFNYDANIIKERYKILQEAGIQNPTLILLVKKDDNFEEFVKRAKFYKRKEKNMILEMSQLISSNRL